MNGFIKRQEVIGLEESLQNIIDSTESQYVKEYFQSVLELPREDRTKWFLTSNEVDKIEDERVDPITTCTIIQTVCVVIITVVTVYNAVTKQYEEKEVEKEKCEDKKIQVPCE